jgi:hypothetical protein
VAFSRKNKVYEKMDIFQGLGFEKAQAKNINQFDTHY